LAGGVRGSRIICVMKPSLALVLALSLAGGFVAAQTPLSLAPTRVLRGVFLRSNTVLGRVDANGMAQGVVADLVAELGRRIGVPTEVLATPNIMAVVNRLTRSDADIAFMAYDEERAMDVEFGPAFMIVGHSYLVKADSRLRASSEIDRSGTVVAAVRGQAAQLFVSKTLMTATVRILDGMPAPAEVQRLLTSGEVTAFALSRQQALEAEAAARTRVRALGDSFLDIQQVVAVSRFAKSRLDILNLLMKDILGSGLVKESITKAGLIGVDVPPAR
jgi:polar amino acid transport system substrate-binding protein